MNGRVSAHQQLWSAAVDLLPLLGVRGPAQRWNNGDLDANPVKKKRVRVSMTVACQAPADEVFALLERAPWSGWTGNEHANVIEAAAPAVWSDRRTAGRLFGRPGLETLWVRTRCDTQTRSMQLVLANRKVAMGRIDVAVCDAASGCTLELEFVETSLAASGNELMDAELEKRMRDMLDDAAASLSCVSAAGPSANASPPPTSPGKRIGVVVDGAFNARPNDLLTLACPVAELAWIDDWQFDLTYSESGRNEKDNIFVEPFTGPLVLHALHAETTWYTTEYDRDSHRFTALTVVGDRLVGLWEWRAEPLPHDRSRGTWSYVFTGISAAGNRDLQDPAFEDRLRGMLRFLEASMRTYIEQGQILRFSHKARLMLGLAAARSAMNRAHKRSPLGW